MRFLLLCLALSVLSALAPVAAPAADLERGVVVRVMRDQMMLFYGKPRLVAKAGARYEVLDVRGDQVYVAVTENQRMIALSLPRAAVELEEKAKKSDRIEKSAALFAGLIPRLNIVIAPKEMEQLRKDPRNYVQATIEEEGGKRYNQLAIKLKGSAGSFRGIDDRPGYSINCSKFKGADRFHGLKRFQLNNCAQDGAALNELVAGEMARQSGVPASRCTHALVTLNGKEQGVYVLKEGFTEEFLAAFFKNTDGHLYDGGFCREIDENMEVDRGDPQKKERLLELVGAMREGDAARQFERLAAVVDVDAYLRYLALETVMGHWDGYSFNRNNYRIYEDPSSGKFHFILHGMDQMFGDVNWPIEREPGGQVGAILWRRPEIRERYHEVLREIADKVLFATDWPGRVTEHGQRLVAALEASKPQLAKEFAPRVDGLRRQIEGRLATVRRLLEAPRQINTLLTKGMVELGGAAWTAQTENGEALEVDHDGRKCFLLVAKGEANLSWRSTLQIPAGKFRFQARVKAQGVDPLQTSSGDGAGLRISGGERKGTPPVQGSTGWVELQYDFEGGRDVVLVAELRARAGELWIDRESLRVSRLP